MSSQPSPVLLFPPAGTSATPPWKVAILLGCSLISLYFGRPDIALAIGVVLALFNLNPFPKRTGKLAKTLIQVCIIILGLSMDLREVVHAGMTGMLFAAGTIFTTFALGILLGRFLKLGAKLTTLLSAGTAICGGSAIAATGTVILASQAQLAVATGCVFILNGIGLYVMPLIGSALHMSPEQFGTWAAIAIHDVSSVVGAASTYDSLPQFHGENKALPIATAIKLTRTLWIIPVALSAGWAFATFKLDGLAHPDDEDASTSKRPSSSAAKRMPIPWFIGWFVLAAAISTKFPQIHHYFPHGFEPKNLAKLGMTLALFLIGAGMSVQALKAVGWRALVLGVSLWIFISIVSLVVVRTTIL